VKINETVNIIGAGPAGLVAAIVVGNMEFL
jgi:flavin-dependent dehydrogenase